MPVPAEKPKTISINAAAFISAIFTLKTNTARLFMGEGTTNEEEKWEYLQPTRGVDPLFIPHMDKPPVRFTSVAGELAVVLANLKSAATKLNRGADTRVMMRSFIRPDKELSASVDLMESGKSVLKIDDVMDVTDPNVQTVGAEIQQVFGGMIALLTKLNAAEKLV